MRKIAHEAEHIYAALKEQLAQEHDQPAGLLHRLNASVMFCREALHELKESTDGYCFSDAAEEIHFFKQLKPLFVAELIYYTEIFMLHRRWPPGGSEAVKKHLGKMQRKLWKFYKEQQDFYSYHRMGRTDHDGQYFTRGNRPAWLLPSAGYWAMTDHCSTGYDIVLGNLAAYERLETYLEELLATPSPGDIRTGKKPGGRHPLEWTEEKTAAVELVYTLWKAGCFNNGKATIAEIAYGMKNGLGIEMGDYYRAWLSIRNRKSEKSFIEKLPGFFRLALEKSEHD